MRKKGSDQASENIALQTLDHCRHFQCNKGYREGVMTKIALQN